MSTDDFTRFVGVATVALDIDPPPQVSHEPDGSAVLAILVGEVPFKFVHHRQWPTRLTLVCSYGAVPEARQADILRRLLEMNFEMYHRDAPVFSIDPHDGTLLLTLSDALEAFDAEGIRATVALLAEGVREWRSTFYLDRPRTATEPAAEFA